MAVDVFWTQVSLSVLWTSGMVWETAWVCIYGRARSGLRHSKKEQIKLLIDGCAYGLLGLKPAYSKSRQMPSIWQDVAGRGTADSLYLESYHCLWTVLVLAYWIGCTEKLRMTYSVFMSLYSTVERRPWNLGRREMLPLLLWSNQGLKSSFWRALLFLQ